MKKENRQSNYGSIQSWIDKKISMSYQCWVNSSWRSCVAFDSICVQTAHNFQFADDDVPGTGTKGRNPAQSSIRNEICRYMRVRQLKLWRLLEAYSDFLTFGLNSLWTHSQFSCTADATSSFEPKTSPLLLVFQNTSVIQEAGRTSPFWNVLDYMERFHVVKRLLASLS